MFSDIYFPKGPHKDMNRPASTYVIIAHFTVSGDFSPTKGRRRCCEDCGGGVEDGGGGATTARGDQGSFPSESLETKAPQQDGKIAFRKTADDFPASDHSLLPQMDLLTANSKFKARLNDFIVFIAQL